MEYSIIRILFKAPKRVKKRNCTFKVYFLGSFKNTNFIKYKKIAFNLKFGGPSCRNLSEIFAQPKSYILKFKRKKANIFSTHFGFFRMKVVGTESIPF